jgi:hypothetical protein
MANLRLSTSEQGDKYVSERAEVVGPIRTHNPDRDANLKNTGAARPVWEDRPPDLGPAHFSL